MKTVIPTKGGIYCLRDGQKPHFLKSPRSIQKNGELNTLLSGFIPMALAPTDFNGHLEFEEREWDEIKKNILTLQTVM
jgi:hypothetical protein